MEHEFLHSAEKLDGVSRLRIYSQRLIWKINLCEFNIENVKGMFIIVDKTYHIFQTNITHSPVKVDGPNETAVIICSSGTTGLPKGRSISSLDLVRFLDYRITILFLLT